MLTACEQDLAHKLSANLYDIYHCCVYGEKLLMIDRGTFRNLSSFINLMVAPCIFVESLQLINQPIHI